MTACCIVPIYAGDMVLAKPHLVIKELVFIEDIIEIITVGCYFLLPPIVALYWDACFTWLQCNFEQIFFTNQGRRLIGTVSFGNSNVLSCTEAGLPSVLCRKWHVDPPSVITPASFPFAVKKWSRSKFICFTLQPGPTAVDGSHARKWYCTDQWSSRTALLSSGRAIRRR